MATGPNGKMLSHFLWPSVSSGEENYYCRSLGYYYYTSILLYVYTATTTPAAAAAAGLERMGCRVLAGVWPLVFS